jgi:hypothetical protein
MFENGVGGVNVVESVGVVGSARRAQDVVGVEVALQPV